MTNIAEMPSAEKPREKALRYGIRSLSNRELLALILRSGPKGGSVLTAADELLSRAGGFSGLSKLSVAELRQVRGISDVKALELTACFEISRRALQERAWDTDVMENPAAVIRWLQKEIGSEMQEKFMVIYLSPKNRILSSRVLFMGTVNEAKVWPREIFREALLAGSSRVILVHNHPSGDPAASMDDIAMTRKMIEAGKIMGVEVLDHIIVTGSSWVSMAERTLMGMEDMSEDDIID